MIVPIDKYIVLPILFCKETFSHLEIQYADTKMYS